MIKDKYKSIEDIPPHSRLNHIPKELLSKITINDSLEKTKSILDIIILSVILDAGAGNIWMFQRDGFKSGRSEGIALASFFLFMEGAFGQKPFQVDSQGLKSLALERFKEGF